jgi:hypothetical protein
MTRWNLSRIGVAPIGIMFSVALCGCYTTTIRSGKSASPAQPTVEYDEKWHSGVVYGLAELSGPHDLAKACPNGWAEIHTETSFLNGLVDLLTWSLYTPQTVTIQCAAGGSTPSAVPNQPSGLPPPPASSPSQVPPPPPSAPPTTGAPTI